MGSAGAQLGVSLGSAGGQPGVSWASAWGQRALPYLVDRIVDLDLHLIHLNLHLFCGGRQLGGGVGDVGEGALHVAAQLKIESNV